MNKLLLIVLSALLIGAPIELSARQVVKHHAAKAQTRQAAPRAANPNCALGATPPSGTQCGISDLSLRPGGALQDTDTMRLCPDAAGCFGGEATYQDAQAPLGSLWTPYFRSKFTATPPLNYNSGTGGFSLTGIVPPANLGTGTPSSSVFLNGAGAWATPPGATGGVTIPTSPLLSGNSTSTLGSVAVGNGLQITGTYPTQTLSGGTITPNPGAHTVTAAEWSSGALFVYTTPGQTLTFPSAATLAAQGGITITTIGTPVTLQPNVLDGINGFTTLGQAQDMGLNISATVTLGTPGTANALQVPLGPLGRYTLTYGPGMNLSTSPLPIVNARGYQTNVIGITCLPGVLVGGTPATIDVYSALEGTTAANVTASGTKQTTTSCAAGTAGTSGTTQVLLSGTPARLTANTILWAVGSGAAWSTPANYASSSGLVQINLQP